MATAADQIAANVNFGAFSKATELKRRIWFTLGCLIVYRLGTFITIPGIDAQVMADVIQQQSGGVLGMFDMFAGGALSRMSIFALNIMPYISAAIIMQLLTAVNPTLEAMKKEGPSGRMKDQPIHPLYDGGHHRVAVSWHCHWSSERHKFNGPARCLNPGLFFQLHHSDHADRRHHLPDVDGRTNLRARHRPGISLLIFGGIIAGLPGGLVQLLELGRTGALSTVLIIGLAGRRHGVIAFIVWVELAHRRILVQYPKRQQGNRMVGGESSHLPLKLNTAGVIPPIFASSILLMPLTVAGLQGGGRQMALWAPISALLGRGQPLYMALYAGFIVFFAFIYTALVFNPEDTADNLKKNGGFIPGHSPGQKHRRVSGLSC